MLFGQCLDGEIDRDPFARKCSDGTARQLADRCLSHSGLLILRLQLHDHLAATGCSPRRAATVAAPDRALLREGVRHIVRAHAASRYGLTLEL